MQFLFTFQDGSISSYSRTPSYGGSTTPMYGRDGSKTPMHGSQTPLYEGRRTRISGFLIHDIFCDYSKCDYSNH